MASTLTAGSPKLLELDKEDVKAVRSFLPGKVLGRIAAPLALVVLVLGFAGTFDLALERLLGFPLEPRWLKYTVLIGIPVLIVGAQIAAEWQAGRKRRQAQALAVKTEAVPEGYFRIRPYLDTADDRAKFDRADRVHEKVLDWLKRADSVPLYLTGDSGSGKSSVLNAFVLPGLRDAGWTVVEARAWQDPETALGGAIVKLAAARKWKLGEARTLRERLEAVARRIEGGLLVVLDQFEEFVVFAGSERQKAFAALIDDLRTRPIKGLRLLLVLRSDYKTAIDALGLPLLRQGENWQEVGRFTIAAGTKFMARSGLALRQDGLDGLATSAAELDDSPGMIRPITLNVLGHVLSEGRATAPSLDAGRLVRHYIEQSVEQPAIRTFAPRVLSELVTEQGTKRPRSEQELVDQTGLRPGEVRAVMNGLWGTALARPLDAAQGVWELSHDFVARAVARYLGRRRVDWSELARAYAAPALLILMAASAGIVTALNASGKLRTQLADIGIDVSADGLEAVVSPRFTTEPWVRAAPLLRRVTTLRSLNLSHAPIANAELLKDFTALQELNLSDTPITNIEPLKGLTALLALDLSYTHVENVEPFKSLTALQRLSLSNTQVATVEPLKGLTALQGLKLSDTQVANVEPFKGLTALQWLDLTGTHVENVEPLKGLTALQSLNPSRTQVANVEPLKGLTALLALDLSSTPVENVEPLNGLTVLQALYLGDTKVTNVEPLKRLITLRKLNLSSTHVEDVAPLNGLTALQALYLGETKVTNVEPLKRLTALLALDLSSTHVENLEPLKALAALQSLNLSNMLVSNIEPLRNLTALQSLFIDATPVVSIEPLKGMTALRQLGLRKTAVSNFEPLAGMTALEELYLPESTIHTLEPLKGLNRLRLLDILETPVTDLAPLKGLAALEVLEIPPALGDDLTPIQDLPHLRKILSTAPLNLEKISAYRAAHDLPSLDP